MDKHLSKGDRLFMFSVYTFLIIFTASILLPLYLCHHDFVCSG